MNQFELLNMGTSLLVLGVGIAIHFFYRPAFFEQYPSLRLAFQFWVFRWWFLAVGWLLFDAKLQQGHFRFFVLGFVDFDNLIVTQAFCWSLLIGDRLLKDEQPRKSLVFSLATGYIILLLWNLLWAASSCPWHVGHQLRGQYWTLLSLLVATANSVLIAFAFAARYRWYSFPMVAIQLAYAVLSIPAYTEAFPPDVLSSSEYPVYSLSLASLKVMSGFVSYWLFVARPPEYSRPKLPRFTEKLFPKLTPSQKSDSSSRPVAPPVNWRTTLSLGVLIGVLANFLSLFLHHWLKQLLPNYLP